MRVSGGVGVALLGAAYGVALGFLAFVSAGFGHGTYILVGVSSAPIGVLGIPAALLGAPLIWAVVGYLLSRVTSIRSSRAFLTAICLHYLGVFVLFLTPTYGDWAYFPRVLEVIPWVVLAWGLLYIVGQAIIWWKYGVQVRSVSTG